MQKNSIFFILFSFLFFNTITFSKEIESTKLNAPLFNNLGSFHHAIKTNVPLAQRFFDQGLTLFYGFEWSEAIRSFQEATRLDPKCAMCYWGLALALGEKANAPMTGHEYQDAQSAIQKALMLSTNESQETQDYIHALNLRFKHKAKQTTSPNQFSCHTTGAELNAATQKELKNYANAMSALQNKFPKDNDAKALYVFALFDVINWEFFDVNGNMNIYTPRIIQILKSILAKDKLHIGGNHYYIHVIEQSLHPEEALTSAIRLKTLVPGSEHLIHMPVHIYFLMGNYHEASDSNQKAINTYKHYVELCHTQGFSPEITYLYHHNFDFLRSTAAMEGRKELALNAARELVANVSPSWIQEDNALQGFLTIPYFVEARFGLWHEILKEPTPNKNYFYALGMWHYARGIAFAHLHHLKDAEDESMHLHELTQQKHENAKTYLGQNGKLLLQIADHVLNATIADDKKDEKSTLTHLQIAMQIQHDMGYHEPPDWYFQLSEALGDVYLKYGQYPAAINMYQRALHQYPNNGWVLYSLAKSYRALGENEKAKITEKEFKKAWEYSDIERPVSIFE